MKKVLFLMVLMLFINISFAQPQWTQKSNLPLSLSALTPIEYNNIIYLFGGAQGNTDVASNLFNKNYAYDPINDSWTINTNMPTKRSEPAVAQVNGKIYVMGGWIGPNVTSNKNEMYDPISNSWSTKSNLPIDLDGSCVSYNNKIYFYGWSCSQQASHFYEYDPSSDTYKSKSLMTSPRDYGSFILLNNKIYSFGTSNSSNCYIYNFATDKWTQITTMPTFLFGGRVCVLYGKIHYIGGTDQGWPNMRGTNHHYIYDTLNNSWSNGLNYPINVWHNSAISFNNSIYVFGGRSSAQSGDVNQVYEYSETPPCSAPIPSAKNQTIFAGRKATLTATGGTNYKWYDKQINGNLLATTSTYITPVLTKTDTFYISNTTTCESARIPVIVFVSTECPTPKPNTVGATRCGAGSVTLSASGGKSYLWYNALTGGNVVNMSATYNTPALSKTTTYYVSNFDSCESVRVPVIANINNISIEAGNNQTITCGNSVTLTTTKTYNGSNKLTYAWSPTTGLSSSIISNPVANPINTTEYTVMISDSICSAFDKVTVNVNPTGFGTNLSVNQQLFNSPPFNVQFNNLTTNMSNYNFTWYFGDGAPQQSNNPTVFHTYQQNGTYDISLTATSIATGCSETIYKNGYIFCSGGTACTHSATINQSSPITGCVGTPVMLSCNIVTGATYQWNFNGVPIENSNSTIWNANVSGNYSVTIKINNCPVTSNIVIVNFNNAPAIPTITPTGSLVYCVGGSVTLSAPAGFTSYLWSTGELTQSITVTTSGNYTVKVFDNTGCSSQSAPFLVGSSPMANPDICIVGVDNTTGHNTIVWNKTVSKAIKQFNIYSEGTQANVFNLIGSVLYKSLSVFEDTLSNPAQQSYRYQISAVDTCGAETSLSALHKSIHLSINQGMGNSWNLIWNYYEGFTFPSYNIYRGTTPANLTLLTTLPSSLNSFTDLNPPAGYVYYQIEAVNPNPCKPTKSGKYESTKSNIATNNFTTFVKNYTKNETSISVYPNPANNLIFIDFPDYSAKNTTIFEILSIEGKLLNSMQIKGIKTEINIDRFSKGVYIIKVIDKNGVVVRRMIKD